jgi:hypothetical protein
VRNSAALRAAELQGKLQGNYTAEQRNCSGIHGEWIFMAIDDLAMPDIA